MAQTHLAVRICSGRVIQDCQCTERFGKLSLPAQGASRSRVTILATKQHQHCGQRKLHCLSRAQDSTTQNWDHFSDLADVYIDLAERLLAATAALQPPAKYIVAIAGVPGSGKSTAAAAVSRHINDMRQRQSRSEQAWAVHVPMDGFHLTRKQLDSLPNPKEAHQRRGADWTFDADQFVAAVREIRNKGFGRYPSFDHAVGDPIEGDIEVRRDHRIVLIEGNYVLLDDAPWRDIRGLVDECWFIDCDVEVAMQRVLRRQTGNGLSSEEASMRITTNDLPNALKIAATRGRADLVLPALPVRRREI